MIYISGYDDLHLLQKPKINHVELLEKYKNMPEFYNLKYKYEQNGILYKKIPKSKEYFINLNFFRYMIDRELYV